MTSMYDGGLQRRCTIGSMLLFQYAVRSVTYALSMGFGTLTRHVSMLYTRVFHPFCLQYDCFLMDRNAIRVYQYPALIVVARLIVSCYLAYPVPQSQFHRAFRSYTVNSATSLWKEPREALRELLQAYVPAVLQLGIIVCDCPCRLRASGTGVAAGMVIECSLFLQRKIKPTSSEGNYKKTICIALLLWSSFHDRCCTFLILNCLRRLHLSWVVLALLQNTDVYCG